VLHELATKCDLHVTTHDLAQQQLPPQRYQQHRRGGHHGRGGGFQQRIVVAGPSTGVVIDVVGAATNKKHARQVCRQAVEQLMQCCGCLDTALLPAGHPDHNQCAQPPDPPRGAANISWPVASVPGRPCNHVQVTAALALDELTRVHQPAGALARRWALGEQAGAGSAKRKVPFVPAAQCVPVGCGVPAADAQ